MSNRKRKNEAGDETQTAAAKTSKKSIADYFNMEGSDGLKKIVNVRIIFYKVHTILSIASSPENIHETINCREVPKILKISHSFLGSI